MRLTRGDFDSNTQNVQLSWKFNLKMLFRKEKRFLLHGVQSDRFKIKRKNALGKDRTCDLLLRRQTLYPLSYKRVFEPAFRGGAPRGIPREAGSGVPGELATSFILAITGTSHKPGRAQNFAASCGRPSRPAAVLPALLLPCPSARPARPCH